MNIGIKNYAQTRLDDKTGRLTHTLEASMLREHIIPSCTLSENGNPSWNIVFSGGSYSLLLDKEGNTIYYSNSISPSTEWDVLYLLRQTLDRQLNEKGFMTLHASALNDGQKTVIIEGASGSGKTSLVLGGPDKGYSFLSNESTVISPKLEVVGGTQIVVYKLDMAKRFFPHLTKEDSPSPGILVITPQKLYEDDVVVEPSLAGLIVNPKIGSDSALFLASKKITKHSLFRGSSRYISGLYMMDDMSRACSIDLDTPTCRENRVSLVNKLIDAVPCYRVEGAVAEVLERIKFLG